MVKESKKIENSALFNQVIINPWITEASTILSERDKYVFHVAKSATKVQVEKAVENMYGVAVCAVNVVNIPRKKRIRGRTIGWKAGYKKAIVTIKKGDKIDFFESKK